jgi:8-oxo-dGTP diphosphatase
MDTVPDHFYRTSVKALILNEEKKFLLIQEEDGLWELPGGGINFGESIEDCLKRELKEEMGIETEYISKQPSYFVTAKRKDIWKSIIVYEIKVKNLNFIPSEECIKIKFFTKEEALKENLFPAIPEFVKAFDPNNH